MNFDAFCMYVKEHIHEYLPEDHKEYRVRMEDVVKNNVGKLRSFFLKQPGSGSSPVQYMELYYEIYQKGIPLDEILSAIAERQLKLESMKSEITEDMFSILEDFNLVKDRIMIWAVGYTLNREMLESVPHKVMGDIAATYRIYFGRDGELEMSCLLDDRLMRSYGITLDQLHEIAVNNSMHAMPVEITGINTMMREVTGDGKIVLHPVNGMLVATYKQNCHGAAIAFYPDVFEKNGIPIDQYYIAPSSVHEFMLIPKHLITLEGANEMIKEINENYVEADEVLSDLAHEYDPVSKQLVIGGTLERNRTLEVYAIEEPTVLPVSNSPAWGL